MAGGAALACASRPQSCREKAFARRENRAKLSRGSICASSAALHAGDVTLDVAAADLVGLTDADTRLRDIEREINRTQHDVAVLLGLAPDARLVLVKARPSQPFSSRQFDNALHELARRRPDLVALQAGYRSQNYHLREAILAQFPSLNVGFNRARDTSDVSSVGFGITIGLPLFNRNRGEIAIQRNTRAQLRAEYQVRLNNAVMNAHLVWTNARLLSRQLRAARARLPALAAMTAMARRGFDSGALDPLIFITLQTNLLAKRSEVVRFAAFSEQISLESNKDKRIKRARVKTATCHGSHRRQRGQPRPRRAQLTAQQAGIRPHEVRI